MPELQIFVKCYLLLMHILLTLAKIRLAWFPNTIISLFIVKTLLLVTHQLDQKKHENVGKTENVDMLCVVGIPFETKTCKQETIVQNARQISTILNL